LPKKYDYSGWSKEELIKRVHALEKRKKYGLVWDEEREPEQVVLQCKKELPVLKEVKEKEIKNDPDKPTHILIEGDNYHALSVLNYTHEKSIDVIYIDPPYNTGNKDFKYNDRWVDKDDSYKHSKWLSFMEKRLVLAKQLLKENGCIFISIDDHEQSRLKFLCEEIFGEKNVETFIWNVKDETEGAMPKTAKYTVRKEHEYLIVCFYDKTKIKFNKYEEFTYIDKDDWNNPDNDPRGNWMSGNISRGVSGKPGSNYFTIVTPSGNEYKRNWSISEEEYRSLFEDNRIYFSKNGSGVPRIKIFQNEPQQVIQSSIFSNVKSSITGKNQIIDILGECDFDHPKPIELIARIIDISSHTDAIILDYFAGTGTTGHSVLYSNKYNNSQRSFILCTNNEENICSNICYPRVEKVIKGYISNKGEEVTGLSGNLIYYKTDFVPAESTDINKEKLTNQSVEMLCLRENTFEFVMEDGSIKIFQNTEKYTAILLDQLAIPKLKEIIKDYEKPVQVYIFSLGDDNFTDEFADMKDNVTVKSIPAAILRVYRRIFK